MGPDPLAGDTIAAIATAPGRGAIAVIRISGPAAARLLLTLCPELDGSPPPERFQRLLTIRHPDSGETLDRALACFFPGPRSYTGEDLVELSTHGGLLSPQLVLGAAFAGGARPAQPGEFTRRAVLNGKLDFTQAEAILDLVDASSPAFHRAAIQQLERGLARRIEKLRQAILRTEALVAYGIDFPDEDEPPVPPERIREAAEDVVERIDMILRTAPEGALLRDGAMVVLAGRPNAGKSSLFNALLGGERSIVTDIPGTTRDAVAEGVVIGGYPFRLVDTAGLRQTPDKVEALGVEVAERYLAAADIVLYCAEADGDLDPADEAFLARARSARVIVARTKADRGRAKRAPAGIPVSVVSGEGLARVREALVDAAFSTIRGEDGEAPIITRERHAAALRAAAAEVGLFLEGFEGTLPMELAATHLAAAATSLEEIIGAVTPDDVLGAVFGEFCVGK